MNFSATALFSLSTPVNTMVINYSSRLLEGFLFLRIEERLLALIPFGGSQSNCFLTFNLQEYVEVFLFFFHFSITSPFFKASFLFLITSFSLLFPCAVSLLPILTTFLIIQVHIDLKFLKCASENSFLAASENLIYLHF